MVCKTMQFGPLALAALLGVAACGAKQTTTPTAGGPAQAQAPLGATMGSMAEICPMAVPEARVEVFDTADGAAIDFTTTSTRSLPELERRVAALAQLYGQSQGGGAGVEAPLAGLGTSGTMGPGTLDDPSGSLGAAPGSGGFSGGSGAGQMPSGAPGEPSENGAETMPGGPAEPSPGQGMPGTTPSGSAQEPGSAMGWPAMRASAYPVPGGSRLLFTVLESSELEQLRAGVRRLADEMRSTGQCPMLQGQMRAPAMPAPTLP